MARWVRATWLGWLLGIPCIIAMAIAGEAVGIGGAQTLVGAGMGMGVGFMQARALRGVLTNVMPWFWSCALGLALPFLAIDLTTLAGAPRPVVLHWLVAIGGVTVGIWQAWLLRTHSDRAGWWVPASLVGWSLASAMTSVADVLFQAKLLRGLWGALAYLTPVAGGGLLLGIVTGLTLVPLLRPSDQ